jgi:hypothetical protein
LVEFGLGLVQKKFVEAAEGVAVAAVAVHIQDNPVGGGSALQKLIL